VDLENGLPHGDAVLIVPSAYAEQASVELNKYWQRQNPMLMNAERFFSASVLADPHIPLTVFTKNIDTILAKKIKKKTSVAVLESVLSPASSLTGQTSRTSKTSVAWQVPPLQQPDVTNLPHSNKVGDRSAHPQAVNPGVQSTFSRRELAQQQRISSLEAQLASLSEGNSRTSGDKSQLSGNFPNSLATAHAQLDGIESVVLNIQTLLQTMSLEKTKLTGQQSPPSLSNPWPSMPRKQLFSEVDPGTQLVLLTSGRSPSASQHASKRRKAPSSPSDLILQHNDSMDSSGEESF
jgi:hypothetical protein